MSSPSSFRSPSGGGDAASLPANRRIRNAADGRRGRAARRGSTPQAGPCWLFDASKLTFSPPSTPVCFAAPGFCRRPLPQTCPKQVGIRLMFVVNPRYHPIECDSCLTSPCRVPANLGNRCSTVDSRRSSLPMSPLLDQSALTDLAERLVAAARRAGADAADALAVRSVSLAVEVREGAVEESERSEGDDVGLRAFVGRRQAVVSTNDVKADVAALAERAVAMAKAAPEDPFAGLADPARLARDVPDLDLLDPDLPTVTELEARAQRAERAGLAVKGVTKSGGASASAGIGGMVLVTSQGFRGAYLSSGQSVSMTAIAGEGTAMERDYDYSSTLHGADLDPPEKVGRTAGERTVERLNPRKVKSKRVPVVFDRRVAGSLVGHLASAINGAAVARKTSFLKDRLGQRLFRPGIRVLDDPLRRRGLRSRPFDAEGVATEL